jgi:hypothetical protein
MVPTVTPLLRCEVGGRLRWLLPLLVVLYHRAVGASAAVTDGVSFGMDLQLRSSADSDPSSMIVQLLNPTILFLDDIFTDAFPQTFTQVRFTVNEYDIAAATGDNVDRFYLGAIRLKGTAYFRVDDNEDALDGLPSTARVGAVAAQAFQEYDVEYLETLIGTTTDPFLNGLTYTIVKINGGGAVNPEQPSSLPSSDEPALETWMIVLIAGTAVLCAVLCSCILWLCCCVSDLDDTHAEQRSAYPAVTKSDSRGTTKTTESPEADSSAPGRPRSLSPVHSIASQDSSIFTYNPRSTTRARSVDKQVFASFASQTTDMDMEQWQQNSVLGGSSADTSMDRSNHDSSSSLPFGNDISAIENKKDLSLIAEGTDEDSATPLKPEELMQLQAQQLALAAHNNNNTREQSRSYLSQAALEDLEQGRRQRQQQQQRESDSNLSILARQPPQDATNHVIQDLHDLSYEIAQIRSVKSADSSRGRGRSRRRS